MGRLAALALSLWLGLLAGAAGQGAAPQTTATAHRNIQHTVRYTELAPDRFKNFWRD
jgi:hypothetical protein